MGGPENCCCTKSTREMIPFNVCCCPPETMMGYSCTRLFTRSMTVCRKYLSLAHCHWPCFPQRFHQTSLLFAISHLWYVKSAASILYAHYRLPTYRHCMLTLTAVEGFKPGNRMCDYRKPNSGTWHTLGRHLIVLFRENEIPSRPIGLGMAKCFFIHFSPSFSDVFQAQACNLLGRLLLFPYLVTPQSLGASFSRRWFYRLSSQAITQCDSQLSRVIPNKPKGHHYLQVRSCHFNPLFISEWLVGSR